MKSKTAVVGVVVCVMALWATFEYGYAAPAPATGNLNIGVVSIRSVISDSQQQAKYRSALMSRHSQLQAQLQSRAREIEAAEAELNTMRPGTEDHFKQLQAILQKSAALEAEQEYLSQRRNLEDKEWMERLYRATLNIIKELAEERGLDMVLERTEPRFPISGEELLTAFSAHKVLYAGASPDLTSEVIKRLDAMELMRR